jgi:hypothetical protein
MDAGKDGPFASPQGPEVLLERRRDFERRDVGKELKLAKV